MKKMNLNQKNNIYIFQTAETLAKEAADLMIKISKLAIEKKGRFVLSLSGGTTPEYLFTLLTKIPYRDEIQWDKTFVFWGDERCVPSDNKLNNANRAKTLLLNHIDIPSINIFPIPVDIEPKEAAQKYENSIKEFFGNNTPRFDLIFLGLGEDGHTASLFPESNLVFEDKRLTSEVYVEEQIMFRITMTPYLINQAHNIIFLVEGENKAKVLKTVLTGPRQSNKFPAQVIEPEDGSLYWLVDNKSAALLPDNILKECS